ncbi:MAG: type transporter [Rariglobus sp.]|jgi:lipopolysaccharide transport system permease protein|nr:type transporter [Rariglobus sp.]
MSSPAGEPPALVIEAGRTERHYWADLWRYRELLGFLAWRDIKVRYQQTLLGAAWALVQPLASVAIFTFVFGRLARMPSGNEPYFLVVMAGQLAWQLFANTLGNTSGSLVGNSHLIAKVYFPRLAVPLSTVAVALVDFAILLGLYVIALAWTGTVPTFRALLLPLFVILTLLLALGAGLWLAALTVRFRDFRIVVPFLLQIGVFATPVGYRTDFLPNWQALLSLNPMTGVIDAYRWCLLGPGTAFQWHSLSLSLAWTLMLVVTGVWYFRRTERSFADII